jgi:hypothetical protein
MNEPEPPSQQSDNMRRKALLGLVFVVLLILGCLLLTRVLHSTAQLQDCVMSGRSNCAAIDSTTPEH